MAPDLKPLLLPQLVEERKRLETSAQHTQMQTTQQAPTEFDLANIYYTTNSSSSDVGSPVTPTFSSRGHLRYSSSVSSLDLPFAFTEPPSSPAQVAHSVMSCVRQLPDVEEEPVERNDLDLPEGLYDCLCDEPFCVHRSNPSMIDQHLSLDYEDLGFMSDTDLSGARYRKSLRMGSAEATLAGITSRIGSRFPNLPRWGTSKSRSTNVSIYEISAESTTRMTAATSSRSSSISSPYPLSPNFTPEAVYSPSPSQSCWGSMESVVLPMLDLNAVADSGRNLERERALATTPLLPPLVTDTPPQVDPRRPQSPTRARSASVLERPNPGPPFVRSSNTTPALSTKPSLTSFRASPISPELPVPFPNILNDDEWSDRLGHANFTILPLPYQPEVADLDSLKKLREDWDLARTNYTKHLFRTGENYGETSKIYGLTEQKWAEVEQSWKRTHDKAVEQILAASTAPQSVSQPRSRSRGRGRGRAESTPPKNVINDIYASMEWKRLEDTKPGAFPRMLCETKFPSRGDEDIVGPMVRDAPMCRAESVDGRRIRLWRNLVDKVGLKK